MRQNSRCHGNELLVLLVEDDPAVLHVSAVLLEDLGCRVLRATNHHDALGLLEDHQEDIALLMTDVVMPGVSGVELAARTRAFLPELPVLFFSAHTEGVISSGRRTRFLHKPFFQEELAEALEQLVEPGFELGHGQRSGQDIAGGAG